MATYHASPSGEEPFGKKMKRFFTNRAVVVTLVTLLLAVTVIIVATVAANRARKPGPGTDGTQTGTETAKNPGGLDVFREEDTLPTYHGNATEKALSADTDAPAPLTLSLPVEGLLTKGHDASVQVWSDTMGDYRVHLGVDIATAEAAPVMAAADGKVERVWNDPMMGTCVAIQHADDVVTVCKNLSAVLPDGLAEGVTVKRGQVIGTVGDSAVAEMAEEPHLHMEVTVNGIQTDPLTLFSAADAAALQNETADAAYESSIAGK